MAFWGFISEMGVQASYDDKLIRRIRLTNQFAFVTFFVFSISAVNYYIIGDIFSAIIIQLFALPCVSVFFLNKKGIHRFTTSFLLITCSIAVFYFDSYSGLASGTHLYYFPMIMAITFVFDYKQKALMFFHFILPLLLLLINVATHYTLFKSNVLTDADRSLMFVFNLTLSLLSIGFFMYLTIVNNIKESKIYEQRTNERKAAEIAIKAALNEKNILLAEIHHRVKNNLSIIASLLNLQINAIENAEAKAILADSKNRVKSMALIHDSLYKSESLSEIDFAKYTKELIDEIHYSYPVLSNKIKISTLISNITLTVNTAIPVGLILNELLTNCFKHAFVGRAEGKIDIYFSEVGNLLKLKVSDDGVGMKEGYEKTESLGMVVIYSLCEQLDGKCKFTVDGGTCFEMEFEQTTAV